VGGGRVTQIWKRITRQLDPNNELERQSDPVVMIGTVPCKLPRDDRLGRLETQEEGQKVRGDDNRIGTKQTQIMLASGWEIARPGFLSLTRWRHVRLEAEKGSHPGRKVKPRIRSQGSYLAYQRCKCTGISKVDKDSRLPYPVLPDPKVVSSQVIKNAAPVYTEVEG
jgi:hypothetical protein